MQNKFNKANRRLQRQLMAFPSNTKFGYCKDLIEQLICDPPAVRSYTHTDTQTSLSANSPKLLPLQRNDQSAGTQQPQSKGYLEGWFLLCLKLFLNNCRHSGIGENPHSKEDFVSILHHKNVG